MSESTENSNGDPKGAQEPGPSPEEASSAPPPKPSPSSEAHPDAPLATPTAASARPERPPRDPGSVLWTALWSAFLALGIAAGASGWERIGTRAAERPLLLLPATPPAETERDRWLETLVGSQGIESGEWLSPKSLVQQVSANVPPALWAQLFDESDAWLPWLLRLQPANPLGEIEAFRTRLEKFREDPQFRLALYDEAALEADAARYGELRRATFLGAGVIFALGMLAIGLAPARARFGFDIPAGAVLSLLLTAAGWYGLNLLLIDVPREQGLRALGTAFGLAALITPMLKGRITQYPRRRDG